MEVLILEIAQEALKNVLLEPSLNVSFEPLHRPHVNYS